MLEFRRLKKRHRGRKRGDVILLSRHVTGDPRKDLARERYLQSLLRQSKTHESISVARSLGKQGRNIISEIQLLEKDISTQTVEYRKKKETINAISEIIGVLRKRAQQGRTRIGDSELKVLVRQVFRSHKLDPKKLKI